MVRSAMMGRPAIIEAWLEDQHRGQAESYLKRGRSFARFATDQLKRNWVNEFHEWVRNANHPLQSMKDIEAELTMRGEFAPCDKVEADWEAMRGRRRTERRKLQRQVTRITTMPLAPADQNPSSWP